MIIISVYWFILSRLIRVVFPFLQAECHWSIFLFDTLLVPSRLVMSAKNWKMLGCVLIYHSVLRHFLCRPGLYGHSNLFPPQDIKVHKFQRVSEPCVYFYAWKMYVYANSDAQNLWVEQKGKRRYYRMFC